MAVQPEDYQERIKWLRGRAEEVRAVAASISHAESKAELQRMAVTYETVASQLESLTARRLIDDLE